jgi:HEAT repeat protein
MDRLLSRLLIMALLCGGAVIVHAQFAPPAYVCPSFPQEEIDQRLPPAVAVQAKRLYSEQASVQAKALFALAGLGKAAAPALPYIFEMCQAKRHVDDLAGKPTTIGRAAEEALATIAKEAPEALLPALDDRESPNLQFAIRAVAGITVPEVERRLLELSTIPQDKVRQEAAGAMLHFYGLPGHEKTTQRVDEMLRNDPSWGVKREILGAVRVQGAMSAGDPREALCIAGLAEENMAVKKMALHRYEGTPSPKLFNAVLATLDRNLCAPIDEGPFLTIAVKQMVPLLTKQLEDQDERVRQRAYLLLYYYTPDVSEQYVDRLFGDPSENLRKQVFRHMLALNGLLRELRGKDLFLHAGRSHRLITKRPEGFQGNLVLWEKRRARERIVRRIMAGTDANLINLILLADRRNTKLDRKTVCYAPSTLVITLCSVQSKTKLDRAFLHKAFADPATRVNAMYCMPAAEFTVDEMLLALRLDGESALGIAIGKLARCKHDDPRLLAEAILVAGREPDLAGQALWAGLNFRKEHAPALFEQLFATARPQLRSVACGVVAIVLPKEQAREILLKRQNDPDPDVRAQVEKLLRRTPPKGQTPVGIKPPDATDLRRAFEHRGWSSRELRYMPRTANPTDGLPDDPTALALLYWAYWRRPDAKREAERRLPDEVAQKILPLLQGDDPAVSDAVAAVFLLGHYTKYAREIVAYMAYHTPRNLPLAHTDKLGEAAAEPLTALIMRHPIPEIQNEARQALDGLLRVTHRDRDKPLPTHLQKCLIVLMLEGADAEARYWALQEAAGFLPKDVHQAVCRKLLESGDEKVRQFMVSRATPSTGLEGARTSEILTRAASASHAQRQTAALRARFHWDDRVRDAMFVLLGDRDSRVQQAAAEALGLRAQSDEEVVKRLEKMLGGDAIDKQLQGLFALKTCPTNSFQMPPNLSRAVRLLAQSRHTEVRYEVTQAARPHESAEDREVLQRLLRDPSRAVAQAAYTRFSAEAPRPGRGHPLRPRLPSRRK